ncbi:hypothetical protein O4328_31885 [Rhodococcus opacus]|uniref:Uncharacterized protein n=1 Tax=Rhodococcus opacus TaxID=37919 RepID=A0ABT4NLH3_RHOOP|nr:hypothetical protein [Rhodococcus opacus]MCZ4588223.1 hypothetical protein [Rhodococcus opacus]MDV7087614.1 hypothetical protein [Rhodococcus opacus]
MADLHEAQPGAEAPPETTLAELIARSGDLKSELVDFVQHARFDRQLTALLREAAGTGPLDEAVLVRTIDHFALEYRLRDGGTVVEQFVAQRRPPLTDDERAMLLGWREVVEGYFEVHPAADDDLGTVVLHNLVDDLNYPVHSNTGPDVVAALQPGMFVYCRIVPVHPVTGHWLISGHLLPFPSSSGPVLAQAAQEVLTADPSLLRRNRDLYQRAWQLQADARASFLDFFGTDLVILPPAAAQARLIEYYRHHLARADAATTAHDPPSSPAAPHALTAEQMGRLPEDYLDADSVGLIYDETEGLNYYQDFGRLDAMFADPALAGDHTHIALLRAYLDDDTVSALPLRRLAQRHPDGVDPVFRTLLRRPRFCWHRDGEDLLRTRKKEFFQRETAPSFTVTGRRLAELLYPHGNEDGIVIAGC